ncbi:MAG: hypothetical protein ABJA93_04605 [Sporichthyaceae bacterium]
MNGEDLKYLANRAEGVRGRADQRLTEVHARIRSARRRRTTEAVAATSAAVLAIVVGIAVLTGPTAANKHNPPPPPANSHTPAANPTRKIVYSDDLRSRPLKTSAGDFVANSLVGALHVGDREVEIGQKVQTVHGGWSMVVTDAGAVYTQLDHSVWFTDGGRPRQIAKQTCASSGNHWGLATENTGSLVAWFDCTPASWGDLVVYDTSLSQEVARHPLRSCRATKPRGPYEGPYVCMPDGIIGKHVYFGHVDRAGRLIDHQFRLDVTSGQVIPAGPAAYADDLRTHPRALVIGDSWRAGKPTDDIGAFVFHAVGSRLVPVTFDSASDKFVRTQAFDTVTRQPVRFRLPTGYHPDPTAGFHGPGESLEGTDTFTPFEWLDDDTVALGQGEINWVGDLITCHLSDGRCDLAVKAPAHDRPRIAPGLGLPG